MLLASLSIVCLLKQSLMEKTALVGMTEVIHVTAFHTPSYTG